MRRFGWRAVLLCASGCAGAVPPPAEGASAHNVDAPPVAPEPAPPPLAAPTHTLPRSAVRAALSQGLGAFLQHVDLDDHPVFTEGKFRGFRIAGLRGTDFWNGVDLKPGDVITRVNGFPIERPEQAQTAFDSLGVASELRISYERDGQSRELVYGIADGK